MKNFLIVIIIALGALVLSSLFVVDEGEKAIVIQFGKVQRDTDSGDTVVFEPGLHFKLPLIDRVVTLDSRIQTLDEVADRFVTSEKKDLIVDLYVKWKIKDFAKYYLATGGFKDNAEILLQQKVNNGLRSEFGTRTISQIVSGERSELMDEAMAQASDSSDELGIEIVDVRVKQINLPLEVRNYIFQRMRTERDAVAREHRSEGKEKAEFIKANMDAKVTVMLADAERNARKLRGEGDAKAAEIYAKTYTKDAEFYNFLRSMDAYKSSFSNKQDVIVLEPDSDFFKYMKNETGKN
ncbi:protease modulator HflC [Paraglaciecola chathamensis]|jgi:membrane protease subunit HflC|uniref:Protein HflC n=3 Tax=Paraglaciecola chathamensis TaxID=368405 RepID=A0A8H9IDA8_9ALTE|nr:MULTISPECIES: protease modulator HflC [Paraglaciecola]AEE21279.1 HflC protein [Glaciecola sp. 4H-3-7+YE-5]MBN26464.1 protease modulator HflC [Alteromonadaceae bacterium]MBJ2137549.1 protease modulator HflC [Paraglaciecola chathamensis]MBU3019847.1 protease modulator HflC [Paraglaciecola agarilytica]MDO6561346.1 protease modulator HflC [Paraglaciecola chathamensis]|tara:strand:- start:462 stop:1346 length:885 start_codon:yes stop_codon:yes gene_type:complete